MFNVGGSQFANCSILEAIELCESISGYRLQWSISDVARKGDHIWWITDTRKFQNTYPEWEQIYDIETILSEILDQLSVLRELENN